jgi:hypothetical protein
MVAHIQNHDKYMVLLSISTIALLSVGLMATPAAGSNSEANIDIKQKQKCKIGAFGDPEGSTSSTVTGLCNQQAQNNIDADSSLGGVGISIN